MIFYGIKVDDPVRVFSKREAMRLLRARPELEHQEFEDYFDAADFAGSPRRVEIECFCEHRWDEIHDSIGKCGSELDHLVESSENKAMELLAVGRQIEKITRLYDTIDIPHPVTVVTDSGYAIKCCTEWGRQWEQRDYLRSNGHKLKNSRLIERVRELVRLIEAYYEDTLGFSDTSIPFRCIHGSHADREEFGTANNDEQMDTT